MWVFISWNASRVCHFIAHSRLKAFISLIVWFGDVVCWLLFVLSFCYIALGYFADRQKSRGCCICYSVGKIAPLRIFITQLARRLHMIIYIFFANAPSLNVFVECVQWERHIFFLHGKTNRTLKLIALNHFYELLYDIYNNAWYFIWLMCLVFGLFMLQANEIRYRYIFLLWAYCLCS